jgi:hypothetical protein
MKDQYEKIICNIIIILQISNNNDYDSTHNYLPVINDKIIGGNFLFEMKYKKKNIFIIRVLL